MLTQHDTFKEIFWSKGENVKMNKGNLSPNGVRKPRREGSYTHNTHYSLHLLVQAGAVCWNAGLENRLLKRDLLWLHKDSLKGLENGAAQMGAFSEA